MSERRELGRSGPPGWHPSAWAATSSAGPPTRRPRSPSSTPTLLPAAPSSTRPTSTPRGSPRNRGGESETIIGGGSPARGSRDDDRHRHQGRFAPARPAQGALPGDHPSAAPRSPSRRLQIERIDLYEAHATTPRRRSKRRWAHFDELVGQGKVRSPRRLQLLSRAPAEALRLTDEHGWPAPSPSSRTTTSCTAAATRGSCGRSASPRTSGSPTYFSLARGFLSGKYRPAGQPLPDSPRAPGVARDYMNDRGLAVLETLGRVAAAHGASHAQVALAWVMAQPGVTCAARQRDRAGTGARG